MGMYGPYTDLVEYLYALDNLPIIVQVKNVHVAPKETSTHSLQMTLDLTLYYL